LTWSFFLPNTHILHCCLIIVYEAHIVTTTYVSFTRNIFRITDIWDHVLFGASTQIVNRTSNWIVWSHLDVADIYMWTVARYWIKQGPKVQIKSLPHLWRLSFAVSYHLSSALQQTLSRGVTLSSFNGRSSFRIRVVYYAWSGLCFRIVLVQWGPKEKTWSENSYLV